MRKILFLRSEKVFLPEIDAYIKYFNKTKEFKAYDSSKIGNNYNTKDFDIIWEFKGLGGLKVKDQILIHEYASLSTGLFPLFKNILKAKINPRPDLRVFLNENVKDGFKFKDNVDYCYRDMGIDENFLKIKNEKKEYEFVYVGTVCKEREIDRLLKEFQEKKPGKLCLIGNVEDNLYNKYKSNKDIIFTGKVSYSEVPEIASKAVYGINYIPDKYPYNIQTSTKLLEYLALGLKVITTDYKWVRQFEETHNCSFYKIAYNDMKLDVKDIEKYEFISNFKPENFLWNNVIERSSIMNKILNLINLHK